MGSARAFTSLLTGRVDVQIGHDRSLPALHSSSLEGTPAGSCPAMQAKHINTDGSSAVCVAARRDAKSAGTATSPIPPRICSDPASAHMETEPMNTVTWKLDAALSLHCRYHTKECCQKPITAIRGLAMNGVKRYFQGWPMEKEEDGALVWRPQTREELHTLMLDKR
eukprot:6176233-Pleurochrysis_carterae.AAC.2